MKIVTLSVLGVLVAGNTHLAWSQCSSDDQCKGDRICVEGACVDPRRVPGDNAATNGGDLHKNPCGGDRVLVDGKCVSRAPVTTSSAIKPSGQNVARSNNKPERGFIRAGVKGGLNLATWVGADIETGGYGEYTYSYDPYEGRKMKPGFAAGFVMRIRPLKAFAIQPECLYTTKGFDEYEEEYENGTLECWEEDRISMDYIEIPVLLKLMVPKSVSPNVYAGPILGFRVRVDGRERWEEDGEGKTYHFTEEDKQWIRDNYRPVDFGLATGLGLDIDARAVSILIDARYTMGFVKLARLSNEERAEGVTESDLPAHRNSTFTFSVGLAFGG